jgi:hypothetical protein
MQKATKGDVTRTVLFDTGPEEDIWERNVKRLRPDLASIDLIMLSHWHRDHSGGMLRAISMINEARSNAGKSEPLVVDLHPDRPDFRGFQTPVCVVSLEADPSFDEVESTGAKLVKGGTTRTVLDDLFLISGEIPRQTAYEVGVPRGLRYDKTTSQWSPDTLIRDERFLLCNLKGTVEYCFALRRAMLTSSRSRPCCVHRMQPCWCGKRHQTCHCNCRKCGAACCHGRIPSGRCRATGAGSNSQRSRCAESCHCAPGTLLWMAS